MLTQFNKKLRHCFQLSFKKNKASSWKHVCIFIQFFIAWEDLWNPNLQAMTRQSCYLVMFSHSGARWKLHLQQLRLEILLPKGPRWSGKVSRSRIQTLGSLYMWVYNIYCIYFIKYIIYDYSPTAECYGVSAQYRFRCVLGELGRFREKTGSGKVPGGFRESSDGFWGLGPRFQGSEVPRFRGSGNRFQWVPRFG